MKQFFIFIVLLGIFINLSAHPWKPDHYVVIDTDCGLDDFRAINLMLAFSNIRILAIITSNGVVNAKDGYFKVKSLLHDNFNEGVLVGYNPSTNQKSMDCKTAIEFNWGNKVDKDKIEILSYKNILNQVYENCAEKITFINMGGLNSFSSYFEENPDKTTQLKEILWTTDYKNLKKSFNYLLDTTSYHSLKKGGINISYINGSSFGKYNSDLIEKIKRYDSHLTKNIYKSLTISTIPFAKNMYDESVVFYLQNKPAFSIDTTLNVSEYRLNSEFKIDNFFIELLIDNLDVQNQVLLTFSIDTSDYISDIQLMMEPTIKKYGKKEWSACVLTNELHRHLGVYSLIGAKMGIRAREYFGAGVDELRVVSFAGLNPPFSCLNDGLQVSTGATLGHGLISVNESTKLPKAEFYYLGQKITISLKEEYRNKILSEINDLSIIYGLDSNIYWDLVRTLAIKYWENWDRHTIFKIEVK